MKACGRQDVGEMLSGSFVGSELNRGTNQREGFQAPQGTSQKGIGSDVRLEYGEEREREHWEEIIARTI